MPVPTEQPLRNLAWIESNRRKVDELSGGKLAYVYMPDTALAGLVIVLGLASVASPAAAQAQYSNSEMACQNDAYRFCGDLIPDRGKVGACLRRNLVRLTPDCRRNFGGRKKLRHR